MNFLLVTDPTNVFYLTGFDGSFGWCLLLLDRGQIQKKYLITDARYKGYVEKVVAGDVEVLDLAVKPMDNLEALVKKYDLQVLNFERESMTFASLDKFKNKFGGLGFEPADFKVQDLRRRKSYHERKMIRKSQSLCELIFNEIKISLKVGVKEKDLAWEIHCLARKYGCDGVAFEPIVAFGEHTACPHHKVTDRNLKKGDLVLIDMGVVWRGYYSDMTRMVFTAPPTAKQKEVYEIVLVAQKSGINALAVNSSCLEVDAVARKVIANAGYGKFFSHSLGHGVGLNIHESPTLSPRSTDKLLDGDVVTIEPGVYLPGEFGVRIEDLVIVGDSQLENLTGVSKSLADSIIIV